MKIAYITYSGVNNYSAANNFNENTDTLPFLQQEGLNIESVVWDDPKVNWSDFDFALLKCPWDYHQKFEAFNSWLNALEKLGVKLLNDYQIVKWNADKHYLKEIANAGMDVIPSVFLDRGWNGTLTSVFGELNVDKIIIKPCISGGSKNTFIVERDHYLEKKSEIMTLLKDIDLIAQPFMEQVREGEWSFLFFGGEYSHTIIKKPKTGDFRVQQIFGGTIEEVKPSAEQIQKASDYISKFAPDSVYARVDGLLINGEFQLMELELIEPFLYLAYHSDAVQRYAQAIKRSVGK